MTVLSVNVNKVAVLRNSRGGDAPSVTAAARAVLAAGAAGVTVHPRPDARHVRTDDVHALAALVRGAGRTQHRGQPFRAPARRATRACWRWCEAARPAQVTLVPDGDGQLTSDHGFDLRRDARAPRAPGRRPTRRRARACRCSSMPARPASTQAAEIGADRIEIYTGPYAEAHAAGDAGAALAALRGHRA